MTACGLWPSRNCLVAVVADDDGRAGKPLLVGRDDEARWGLLEHLDATVGLDCELILPEHLLRSDSIGRLAMERGMAVYVTPHSWVAAICAVAGLATGPPARRAAMLARFPVVPSLRPHLRLAASTCDYRQLKLL